MLRLALLVFVFSSLSIYSQNLTQYIRPTIGTGGHGHTFPGATLPFAMVQLSPDTRVDGSWDGCSGYHYSDEVIYGFSHTHLSGTGCSDYGDIAFMPFFGKELDKYSIDTLIGRGVKFSHKNEEAKAGYYRVKLDNGVQVELTSTLRAGMQRYTFSEKGKAIVVMNLKHRDELLEGKIEEIDILTYKGKRVSKAWAERQQLFFSFQLSKLPIKNEIIRGDQGDEKILFEFIVEKGEQIMIKTGISGVDEMGAIENLEKEMSEFDFEKVRINANAIWHEKMSLIKIYGGTDREKTNFYTALYHCMIHPSIFSDVDGRYRGRDNLIYDTEGKFDYYTVFSLWDTYRALHPLLCILEIEKTNDFIESFLAQYEQVGKLPIWELWGNETNCMIGYHAVSVIWDAYNKGIRTYSSANAMRAMLSMARDTTNPAIKSYIQNGYVKSDDDAESVSKTLEYAYNDWCIAQMGKSLGSVKIMDEFTKRSRNWINVWDTTTGYMRPRLNSTLLHPFTPYMVDNHYTEANSFQYSFYVPHDLPYFKSLYGGEDAFDKKLDTLFSVRSTTEGRDQADISGLIGQYAHGNEPSHHIAFLYKNREKRNNIVKRIRDSFYTNEPDGLIGNEDCGQMSAWYVMASLGMYPVCPGDKRMVYVEGLFDSVKIKSQSWTIHRTKNDSREFYNLAGQDLTLPNYDLDIQRQPYLMPCDRIFRKSQWVKISGGENIHYRIGDFPWKLFKDSILIDKSCKLDFYNTLRGKTSNTHTAYFHKLPEDRTIKLISKYNKQYHAGGDMALLDGIRGNTNWRRGDWHGYQSQDFEAVIQFNSTKSIHQIRTTFLQDQRSWIFYPAEYKVSVSDDGIHFREVASEKYLVTRDENQNTIREVKHNLSVNAKYVKVWAKNYGKIPNWHPGKGGDAFIFIDEISID